jgi:hypothetical protein
MWVHTSRVLQFFCKAFISTSIRNPLYQIEFKEPKVHHQLAARRCLSHRMHRTDNWCKFDCSVPLRPLEHEKLNVYTATFNLHLINSFVHIVACAIDESPTLHMLWYPPNNNSPWKPVDVCLNLLVRVSKRNTTRLPYSAVEKVSWSLERAKIAVCHRKDGPFSYLSSHFEFWDGWRCQYRVSLCALDQWLRNMIDFYPSVKHAHPSINTRMMLMKTEYILVHGSLDSEALIL